jgi:hypothetical protein
MGDFEDIMGMQTVTRNVLEKVIEKKVKTYAQSLGWKTFKFVSPANPSVCDRIFVNRYGVVIFIEFKQKGKNLTPKQQQHADALKANLANVFMIDNIEDGIALVNKWHNSVSVITHDFF